jgi:hypothetical protein
MDSSHFRKYAILLILFSCCLLLSITFGYPRVYLTDEWISANQLNHLMEGKDLLYGYEPYGGSGYQESHKDILVYTLVLPIVAIPEFLMFTALGDFFRLFVNILWLGLLMLTLLLIHNFYPKYVIYKNIPWTYAVFGSSLVLFILNMWLYTPFSIDKYPEIAAITFTNNILFAGSMVLVFLICQKIFQNQWWSVFGVVSVICGSSYLFWSEVGKDHILTLFFFLISLYFFISWIHSDSLFHLISSYIGIGWVAWVRPDVGSGLFILTILAGIMLTFQKGIRNEIKVFFCSFATLFGAIPLFLNNYGLTGNVLTTPLAIKYQAISDSSVEVLNEMLATNYYAGFPSILDLPVALYHVLFDPVYPFTAGFFQVSPVSFLAVFCIGYLVYHVTIKKQFFDSEYEKMTFFGILFIAIGLILPQLNNVIQLGESRGIVPDIRYLSLLYFPLIILGLFFLKRLEFHEQDLKKTLESFFLIGIVTLPLSFIAIQADSQVSIGLNRMVQMQIVGWISYVLLGFVVVCIVLIMAKKIDKECLHYILPLLFIANCIWFIIVGFRFAYTLWEHYNFWLPVLTCI